MPKYFPPEFKPDVVTVARSSGLTQAQVARDFRISEKTVAFWVKQANVDDGLVEGATSEEQAELVALRRRVECSSRRSRSCVARRRTSQRTRPQNDVPAGP